MSGLPVAVGLPFDLPQFIAIKSISEDRSYLIYVNDTYSAKYGKLYFHGQDSKIPEARFELVQAATPSLVHAATQSLVHIKCSSNNRYLRTVDENSNWLTPEAVEIDENDKNWSCTLFQPMQVSPPESSLFQFLHVQRKLYATPHLDVPAAGTRLWLDTNNALPTLEIINLSPLG